jgi:predicted DNA-binding protein
MISLPEYLEKPFLHIAEREHKSADTLLAQLVADYLEDYHDARLAEQAIKRIEDGQDTLLDWQTVKAELYDVDNQA